MPTEDAQARKSGCLLALFVVKAATVKRKSGAVAERLCLWTGVVESLPAPANV